MGQVEDMFEMSNQEAANIFKSMTLLKNMPRGSGKSLTASRYVQAIRKAIDILEKTPDEKKRKQDISYGGCKLFPDCDNKNFHPVEEFDGGFYTSYKCPKCRKIWTKHDDE